MGGGGESGGSYELVLGDVTREIDILRVPYSHNTLEDVDGDITADGEPDILEFDLHFFRKELGSGFKNRLIFRDRYFFR
jgi:hypothetical protein